MTRNAKFGLFATLACAFVLAIALVGCGGAKKDEGSAAKTEDAANTTAASTDAGYKLVESGKLISVSDMECPPFSSYKDGTSEPEGFEVDLMKAVAEKMGLESVWLPKMDFDAIIPLIKQGGKADVGVANFTITDERKQEIDFTDPYYVANIGFVTKADTEATSTDDFNTEGIRIGAQSGTTGEAWAKENLPNAEVVAMIPSTAMLSVQSSEEGSDSLNAMVCDLPVATSLIEKSYSDLKVLESIATGDEFGIVVSKDNPELTKALNKALAELKSDGTIDELMNKWLA
ncbi:MAG: amino acid ABC transporter substrate-binding protein [Atopobiaceae bacterium]|nr:amino acid ABC transporter substrate-binding protein [Atopobiaceae bacterium]